MEGSQDTPPALAGDDDLSRAMQAFLLKNQSIATEFNALPQQEVASPEAHQRAIHLEQPPQSAPGGGGAATAPFQTRSVSKRSSMSMSDLDSAMGRLFADEAMSEEGPELRRSTTGDVPYRVKEFTIPRKGFPTSPLTTPPARSILKRSQSFNKTEYMFGGNSRQMPKRVGTQEERDAKDRAQKRLELHVSFSVIEIRMYPRCLTYDADGIPLLGLEDDETGNVWEMDVEDYEAMREAEGNRVCANEMMTLTDEEKLTIMFEHSQDLLKQALEIELSDSGASFALAAPAPQDPPSDNTPITTTNTNTNTTATPAQLELEKATTDDHPSDSDSDDNSAGGLGGGMGDRRQLFRTQRGKGIPPAASSDAGKSGDQLHGAGPTTTTTTATMDDSASDGGLVALGDLSSALERVFGTASFALLPSDLDESADASSTPNPTFATPTAPPNVVSPAAATTNKAQTTISPQDTTPDSSPVPAPLSSLPYEMVAHKRRREDREWKQRLIRVTPDGVLQWLPPPKAIHKLAAARTFASALHAKKPGKVLGLATLKGAELHLQHTNVADYSYSADTASSRSSKEIKRSSGSFSYTYDANLSPGSFSHKDYESPDNDAAPSTPIGSPTMPTSPFAGVQRRVSDLHDNDFDADEPNTAEHEKDPSASSLVQHQSGTAEAGPFQCYDSYTLRLLDASTADKPHPRQQGRPAGLFLGVITVKFDARDRRGHSGVQVAVLDAAQFDAFVGALQKGITCASEAGAVQLNPMFDTSTPPPLPPSQEDGGLPATMGKYVSTGEGGVGPSHEPRTTEPRGSGSRDLRSASLGDMASRFGSWSKLWKHHSKTQQVPKQGRSATVAPEDEPETPNTDDQLFPLSEEVTTNGDLYHKVATLLRVSVEDVRSSLVRQSSINSPTKQSRRPAPPPPPGNDDSPRPPPPPSSTNQGAQEPTADSSPRRTTTDSTRESSGDVSWRDVGKVLKARRLRHSSIDSSEPRPRQSTLSSESGSLVGAPSPPLSVIPPELQERSPRWTHKQVIPHVPRQSRATSTASMESDGAGSTPGDPSIEANESVGDTARPRSASRRVSKGKEHWLRLQQSIEAIKTFQEMSQWSSDESVSPPESPLKRQPSPTKGGAFFPDTLDRHRHRPHQHHHHHSRHSHGKGPVASSREKHPSLVGPGEEHTGGHTSGAIRDAEDDVSEAEEEDVKESGAEVQGQVDPRQHAFDENSVLDAMVLEETARLLVLRSTLSDESVEQLMRSMSLQHDDEQGSATPGDDEEGRKQRVDDLDRRTRELILAHSEGDILLDLISKAKGKEAAPAASIPPPPSSTP